MREIMYDQSSFLIGGILFASMALTIELGYRFGRRSQRDVTESSKAHVNGIHSALLGVLALLLGFTFSLSLQRFDKRSEAVIDETNAIGTAYLRAQLLPVSVRGEVLGLLKDYVDLRVRAGALNLVEEGRRQALLMQAGANREALWRHALRAAQEDARPVTSGLFIQALNEMFDSYGRRDSALERHVPEVVLFLLYATFLLTGSIVGYAAGLGGHRASFATYVMVTLVVLLVFIIIDLDRPRRGLIEVNQSSLTSLQAEIAAASSSPARSDTSSAGERAGAEAAQ